MQAITLEELSGPFTLGGGSVGSETNIGQPVKKEDGSGSRLATVGPPLHSLGLETIGDFRPLYSAVVRDFRGFPGPQKYPRIKAGWGSKIYRRMNRNFLVVMPSRSTQRVKGIG